MNNEEKVLLKMRHINKTFPGVKALSDVDFTLRAGEIHALMGENGQVGVEIVIEYEDGTTETRFIDLF